MQSVSLCSAQLDDRQPSCIPPALNDSNRRLPMHHVVPPPVRDTRPHHRPPARRTYHGQSLLRHLQIVDSAGPKAPLRPRRVRHPSISWVKAFPDLSNSPAHYIRILKMGTQLATVTDHWLHWIRAFYNVELPRGVLQPVSGLPRPIPQILAHPRDVFPIGRDTSFAGASSNLG